MKIDETRFVAWSDEQTLKFARQFAGLEPIVVKLVKCKRCIREFKSDFVGGRRINHFCGRCGDWMAKQAEEWI